MQLDPESSPGPTQAIQPNNNNVNNNNNNNVVYLNEEDLLESDSDFQPDQSLLGNAFHNDGDVQDTTTSGRVKRYLVIIKEVFYSKLLFENLFHLKDCKLAAFNLINQVIMKS